MVYCCVPYCRSCTIKEKVSFHQIPADYNRRALWLKAIARRGPTKGSLWVPNQFDAVCQKHFKQDDYKQGPKRLVLKKDAIPSIFPNYPTYLQPQEKKHELSIVRVEANKTFVQSSISNVSESLKNNKDMHCDFTPIASSTSESNLDPSILHLQNQKFEANRTLGQPSSNVLESFESDKDMHCDFIPIFSSTSESNLDPSILHLQNQNAILKRKIKVLISNLSRARKRILKENEEKKFFLKENADLMKENTMFSGIEKAAAEGSKHAIFIMDQIKSCKNKKLHWNPEVIKLCVLWHSCFPSGYRYMQNSKFLNLPSESTLKRGLKKEIE